MDDFGGLLSWPALQEWIARQDLPGSGPVTKVVKLNGGTQNNLFVLWRGDERLVLRRPPEHVRANSNDTMLREARVLKALAGSDVPHPAYYGVCDDLAVIGTCFYLMAPLEGFSPKDQLPGQYALSPNWRYTMGVQLVQAAAALASVDYAAAGLAGLGKPLDWHARQVERWRSQLDGYRSMPDYGGHTLPHVDEVGRWLSDHAPRDGRIGIIHGDFQFPNVMFSLEQPVITGVIDWELTTLGDPLLDLGWILSSWWEEGDPAGKSPMVQPWQGFASRAECIRLYGELTGRDMSSIAWYFTLACFKLACIIEGTYARAKSGQAPMATGERLHAYALWLMTKAAQAMHG